MPWTKRAMSSITIESANANTTLVTTSRIRPRRTVARTPTFAAR